MGGGDVSTTDARILLHRARVRLLVLRLLLCAVAIAAIGFGVLWLPLMGLVGICLSALALAWVVAPRIRLRIPIPTPAGKRVTLWTSDRQPDAQILVFIESVARAVGVWREDAPPALARA